MYPQSCLSVLGLGTVDCGSAKVCSHAIFETCFFYDKAIWIAANDCYIYFYFCAIDSYTPINKFYSFVVFSLLINGNKLSSFNNLSSDTL